MKNKTCLLLLLMVFGLMACSGGSGDTPGEPGVRELQINQTETEFIATEADVDTYHFRAAETNRYLNVNCEEKVSGSGVELLVTVFEENTNGERIRIFGKHKPQGATLGADLDLLIYIDRPKDLYITVRDLNDDDASSRIPYYLRLNYQDSADGNHNFSNAKTLTVGSANAVDDVIGEVGEVDCFTFDIDSSGVYSVTVEHDKPHDGSPVQLAMTLYDGDGNRIQRLTDPDHIILTYLTRDDGLYFVTVEDSDSMHEDDGAPYNIRIESVTTDEVQTNDIVDDATLVTEDAGGVFTAAGTMDYASSSVPPDNAGDTDWYRITIGQAGGPTTYHQVQLNIDSGETVTGSALLRVIINNSAHERVTSHDFQTGSAVYQNQFRATNGVYYVSVSPADSKRLTQGTTYRVQLQLAELNDDAEQTDDNTVNSAISLTDGTPATGIVSYHSDVDWYGIDIDTGSPKILAVELTTDTTVVDHQLTIWRGEIMIKKVADLNGSDGPTHLKTSILVPQDLTETATYHFKVCDAQNDEGSSVPYQITADIAFIPDSVASIGQIPLGGTLRYYSETDEEPNGTVDVELEVFSSVQPTFKANTTWLDFRNSGTPGISTATVNGLTTITFPWIAGYIDYQEDRDLFQIDLGKLDPVGTETSWYYDVEVRMVVPPPGSKVEYVWKLYRDSNQNNIIMDDPTSPDGYKACAGDTTPREIGPVDITTPEGDEVFWIGSQWGNNAKFYLGISDFNYLRLPDSGDDNTEPDNDWGYETPYYFTMTLTYHPGQAFPD